MKSKHSAIYGKKIADSSLCYHRNHGNIAHKSAVAALLPKDGYIIK